MKRRSVKIRKLFNGAVSAMSVLAALLGIFFLAWILLVVLQRGFESFNYKFFTDITLNGKDGGVANATLGTFMITAVASLMGVPLGLLGGIFLSEFARHGSRIGDCVRFSANVMMGMPSIIVGLFVYTVLVAPQGHFSGFSGAVALAIIMLPVVQRTTEDMLSLVPNSLREAALALGTPRWKVTLHIVFRAAKTGLITGVLLAIARVSGETAPLLFTALNCYYWPAEPWYNVAHFFTGPTANLTVTINDYAMSPFKGLIRIAWGASLLITFAVLSLNIAARYCFKDKGS